MRKTTFGCFAALAVCVIVGGAQGAIVLQDDFDSYANQAAFQAAWPAVGSQPSGTLSSSESVSAPNSVNISAGTTTTTSQRNGRSFAETGSVGIGDQIVWSFDFFDEAPTVNPYRQYANLQDTTAPTGTNQLISMGLNNNQLATASGGNYYMARILGYSPLAVDPDGGPGEGVTGSGAYFKLNDFGVGLRSTGWHNLKVIMSTDDGNSTDYAFYVDNVLAERVSNVGSAATIRSYDNIRIGAGVSSTNQAYFDNMHVEFIPVPEPSSLAVLGLAGGLLMRRRRA